MTCHCEVVSVIFCCVAVLDYYLQGDGDGRANKIQKW